EAAPGAALEHAQQRRPLGLTALGPVRPGRAAHGPPAVDRQLLGHPALHSARIGSGAGRLTLIPGGPYPPAVPYKYISVGRTATYVPQAGPTTLPQTPPDLGRGRPVVCLHGSSLNQAVFDPLFERLAPQHSPVAFDMPGHGRSGGLDSLPSIEAMA